MGESTGTSSFNYSKDWLIISGGEQTSLWRCNIAEGTPTELRQKAQQATGCKINEFGVVEPLSGEELMRLLAKAASSAAIQAAH